MEEPLEDGVDLDVQRQQTLFILGELERLSALMKRLRDHGALKPEDDAIVQLQMDLKHAERKAKILKTSQRDTTEIDTKLQAIRRALASLGATV